MPTLNIGGQRIKVDDGFLSLSPEQQSAAVDEIAKSLSQQAPSTSAPADDGRNNALGMVDTFVRGMADTSGLGFADEISAGLGTGFGLLGDYGQELERQRSIDRSDAENRGWTRLAGQIGGGLLGGWGLARLGGSFAANAARAGGGLGRVAMGSAADGALLGALHGAGSGEGVEGRAKGALIGGGVGLGTGLAAPYAIAGVQAAARPLLAPLMSRLRPETYANRALGEGLRRADMTADEVAAKLARAQADDQGMFMAADAMGHSGQRMLSTVARNPNDMRQQVVDALIGRQMGQGDRLSQFLAEGFDAADTAAQRQASLTASRRATANANYGAAREGAGVVDPSGAIRAADDFLTPGATRLMNPGNSIADDSIESAVRRARSYLTDGRSVLTDFNAAFRSKQEIDAMIEGARPAVQRQLIPIRDALDDALENASPSYAQARDVFRQQSRAIDAVDTGKQSASGRVRSADSIQRFNAMTPEEQAAFRAGYADPLIARVEATAAAPGTNKARPLITPKTGDEFPAFAAPGRADRLGNRIAREQQMFETSNAALGGSKTADNLADAADMAQFDPELLTGLLSGTPIRSILSSVGRRVAAEAGGMSPRVIERVGRALIETNPKAAKQLLTAGAENVAQNELRRAVMAALIGGGSGATAARLAAP